MALAIHDAAADVARGGHDDHFPIDVFQTGSGTSSNMNMNEVIARLASSSLGRPVHPNDHVNASQSSNDVFPSAIHVAATRVLSKDLIPALEHLAKELRRQQRRFRSVVKAGRTHLMDATPVTLGQEFGGYAQAIENGIERIVAVLPRVASYPSAEPRSARASTAPVGSRSAVVARLATDMQLPLTEARDHFEAQGARDALVEASGVCRVIAVSLNKIAADIRWMGSGPNAGLAEIHIPDLQPGSSIMPGKVNPVAAEAVQQVVAQVIGNDAAVACGGCDGQLRTQRDAARDRAEPLGVDPAAVGGVTGVRRQVHPRHRGRRGALLPIRGVVACDRDRAQPAHRIRGRGARVVKQAQKEGRTIRDIVVDEGLVSAAEADKVLDVMAMTKGGVAKYGPPSAFSVANPAILGGRCDRES